MFRLKPHDSLSSFHFAFVTFFFLFWLLLLNYSPPYALPFPPYPPLSSVLTYIFMIDVALPHTRPTSSPHVAEFVTRVLERLKPLTSEPEIHNHVHEENTQETDERTQAVKLLKTGQNMDANPKHCGG